MTTIGSLSLVAATVAAVYALVASVAGARRRSTALAHSGENAMLALTFFVTLAVAGVVSAILRNDFSLEFVARHSSRELPAFYKWTALCGGMEGSLLFWLWILCGFSAAVVIQGRRGVERLMPYAIATLSVIALFFLFIIQFLENPFHPTPVPVANGQGLNPLLQDPGMAIHPPMLYLGFVGLSVPFAFAMAALLSGQLDTVWIDRTRKWAVGAWFFLGMGNLLGAWWAYHVLGWGGYWGWDPVENSAFLPWLVITAYIHSIQIEERRGMLRSWNMLLVIFAWLLTINGTFLTRSGVITSVHAFAEGPIGRYFFGFILASIAISVGLVIHRSGLLRSRERLQSLLSREAAFLLNNLILVCGAFAVLWGTLFPILSEAVTGEKITISAPFFLRIMIPIGIAILALMGIGPLISWRRATAHNFRRNFVWPIAIAVVAGVYLLTVHSVRRIDALLAFVAGVFVMAGIVIEFYRGLRTRMRMSGENPLTAGARTVMRSRRRYGGYLVHAGVVIVFCGFAGSAFNQKFEADLDPGQSFHAGGYEFLHEGLDEYSAPTYDAVQAHVLLSRDGKRLARLNPEFRFFRGPGEQRHTRVAILSDFRRDVYVFLAGFDEQGGAAMDIHINPLVSWVWGGGIVLIAGTFISLWPARRRSRAALGVYGEEFVPARKAAGG